VPRLILTIADQKEGISAQVDFLEHEKNLRSLLMTCKKEKRRGAKRLVPRSFLFDQQFHSLHHFTHLQW
jgi:hypothetical protein